jgi:hypothetical protein
MAANWLVRWKFKNTLWSSILPIMETFLNDSNSHSFQVGHTRIKWLIKPRKAPFHEVSNSERVFFVSERVPIYWTKYFRDKQAGAHKSNIDCKSWEELNKLFSKSVTILEELAAKWEACRAPVAVMYAQCESFSTFPPDPADVLVPPSASIDTPPLPAASSATLYCKMNSAGWIATYLGETNLCLFIPSYWLTNDNGWSWWESREMSLSFYLLLQISSLQTGWSDSILRHDPRQRCTSLQLR